MVNPSSNALIFFGIAAALAFFFPLFRDGEHKQLSFKTLTGALVPMLAVLVPFALLFGAGAALGMSISLTLPVFLVSALLTFVLSRLGLSAPLRGVLLLACAVGFSFALPIDNTQAPLVSAIFGILSARIAECLLFKGRLAFDDVIAPLAWLVTVLWSSVNGSQPATISQQSLVLLGALSVCLVLRVFQRPFMTDDRWLLKRVVLAATGGLGILLVVTKIVLAVDMSSIAILAGVGMFAAYLFQNVDLDGEEKITATLGIQQLVVIGILTLAATRFFGMYGLLMLVPAALLPVRGGFAQYAALFFLSRVLLQCFISVYNSNITGINVTHAYTGAALYAGFLAIAIVYILLKEITDRRILAAIFLSTGVIIPLAASYYVHAEPTSSLLVGSTVAAVIFACLGPALRNGGETVQGHGVLLLLPSMMAAAGITFGDLIELGVAATNEQRLTIIGAATALAAVVLVISWVRARKETKPPERLTSLP